MLDLLTIASVKWIGFRRFDNARPRDPAFYEDPIRARALGAHQNGIEAFPFFAVAVLLAEFRAGPQRLIDELAVLFLIVRIAYVFTYVGNRPTLRSILWTSASQSTSRSSSCRRSAVICRCRVRFSGKLWLAAPPTFQSRDSKPPVLSIDRAHRFEKRGAQRRKFITLLGGVAGTCLPRWCADEVIE